jgi:hypothetical protein
VRRADGIIDGGVDVLGEVRSARLAEHVAELADLPGDQEAAPGSG